MKSAGDEVSIMHQSFEDRRSAVSSLKEFFIREYQKGLCVNKKTSGSKSVHLVCPLSLVKLDNKKGKIWLGNLLEDDKIPKKYFYSKRNLKPFCGCSIVVQEVAGNKWRCTKFERHHDMCLQSGKINGWMAQKFLHGAAGNGLTGAQIIDKMCGNEGCSRTIACSERTARRARQKLQHKTLQNNDERWAYLQYYAEELKQKNPLDYIALEVDEGNRFSSLTYIPHSSKMIILHAGLPCCSLDCCHSKHEICSKTITIQLFIGRTGNNTNVIAAIRIQIGETNANYESLVKHMILAGYDEWFFKPEIQDFDNSFDIITLIGDGHEGIAKFVEYINVVGENFRKNYHWKLKKNSPIVGEFAPNHVRLFFENFVPRL